MTSKDQITISSPVRDKLKLHAGDRLDFIVESDGSVRSVPVTSFIREFQGQVPAPKRMPSLDAMDDAIARGAAKR